MTNLSLRHVARLLVVASLSLSAFAAAQESDDGVEKSFEPPAPRNERALIQSDRQYLIAAQADTMTKGTFRVGTVDQLQTVQGLGAGYLADIYVDYAPLSWLQVGATMNYGSIGDPAVQNIAAPTAYVKAQFLRQETVGFNMAGGVSVKKVGFGRPTDLHPNDGEIEAQVFADKRIGRFSVSANAIFGKSFSVPDSDAELKLASGYFVLPNLLVGLDSITRYDTSFDGGPKDGTRYWEFTGGAMATWKIDHFNVSGLAGVSAPFHANTPNIKGPGVGPTGMVQLGYTM